MQIISKIKIGDVTGILYLERLGYSYRVTSFINGRREIVARSCVYFKDAGQAMQRLEADMFIITGQLKLF